MYVEESKCRRMLKPCPFCGGKDNSVREQQRRKKSIKWTCGCFTEFGRSDIGKTIFADIKSAERASKERNEYNARIR